MRGTVILTNFEFSSTIIGKVSHLSGGFSGRARPGNLPDSEVTSKVNKQIRYFWSQNDCLLKNSLPHQEVNSNPLTFENIPKKLILHCFRRHQKNNFNQEQRLRFQPIREHAEG